MHAGFNGSRTAAVKHTKRGAGSPTGAAAVVQAGCSQGPTTDSRSRDRARVYVAAQSRVASLGSQLSGSEPSAAVVQQQAPLEVDHLLSGQ